MSYIADGLKWQCLSVFELSSQNTEAKLRSALANFLSPALSDRDLEDLVSKNKTTYTHVGLPLFSGKK